MNKYDEAIEYLRENPDEVYNAWNDPSQSGGELFKDIKDKNNEVTLCLTQFKSEIYANRLPFYLEKFPFLSELVNDSSIPDSVEEETAHQLLPVLDNFKEWQERLDRELGEDRNEL